MNALSECLQNIQYFPFCLDCTASWQSWKYKPGYGLQAVKRLFLQSCAKSEVRYVTTEKKMSAEYYYAFSGDHMISNKQFFLAMYL